MNFRVPAILLFLSLYISGCQKPDEVPKDQKSIVLNEQAYPGVKGEIHTFLINGDTVTCEKIDDKYVYQGDIILTEEQLKNASPAKGAGLESFVKRWPDNIVYYEIKRTFPYKSRITKAIKYWEENTPLKFVEKTLYSTAWIEFVWDKEGSYSNIGMAYQNTIPNFIGLGIQFIGLADWADVGTVIHEIGHAVGLIHENSRSDRDEYITVNLNNVEPGKEHNFKKLKTQFKTSAFDFNSVMLCSSYSYSKNGLPTITKVDGSTFDVQREILSIDDINEINIMYLTPVVNTSVPSNITEQSATIKYDVSAAGVSKIIETGIWWGASPDPEKTGTKILTGSDAGSYSISLTGLTPGTKYYVKAYATNSAGTFYGSRVVIKTRSGKVTDIDGNVYYTINIGTQLWMAENLKTTKFNDGSSIPNVPDNSAWASLITPGYCWYNNLADTKYGALYNFYTVKTGKLCPSGWHAPTETDWKTLEMYLGMSLSEAESATERGIHNEGGKLKEAGTDNWYYPNTGATNESGFTGLPGGRRIPDGTFDDIKNYGYWWSSATAEGDGGWLRALVSSRGYIIKSGYTSKCALSVRCVKD